MQKFKVLFFNLLLLFVLLTIVELSLRFKYPEYQYYYRTHPKQPDLEEILAKTDTSWLTPDQDLGWVCQQKEQLSFPSPPVEGIAYQINEQGFRNSFNFQDSFPPHQKRILLIGDSFLFGIYQPEEKTILAHLQASKGEDYLFFNIAVPAWGLDQMYLAYQKYVELIQPDQVIFTFVDDDLMRSLEILFHGCGRKPCLKVAGQQLVTNTDNPAWWEYLCWNNQIGNRLLLAHYQTQAIELAKVIFSKIIQHEKASGRRPSFLRIPAWVDLQKQEPRTVFDLTDFMEAHEVQYLELYDHLIQLSSDRYSQYYIADDGHFTEQGTKMAAEYLLPWIIE